NTHVEVSPLLSHMLVSCPRNTRYFVAIKMGRRQGGRSRTGGGGSISEPIRDRGATQPPAHFHRHPLGRGQLAVFPRCSLLRRGIARVSIAEALTRAKSDPFFVGKGNKLLQHLPPRKRRRPRFAAKSVVFARPWNATPEPIR